MWDSKMDEMSLWLIVFVKIMAREGAKAKAWAWHVSMYSRLWCILALLNLNRGGALKRMFSVLIHQADQLVVCFENDKLQ